MYNPFRYFNSSPEVIRLAVMMYIRYPLSLRQVEDLLFKRRIDVCHETVRFWWNLFGPLFAAEIRKRRVQQHRHYSCWRWHVDEVFVKINGDTHYLWRAKLVSRSTASFQSHQLSAQPDEFELARSCRRPHVERFSSQLFDGRSV